jgi:hypothetical protein
MRKIYIYSAFLFISLFSLSCSMQDHVLPTADVYVSGFEFSDGMITAKYWKNGQAVNLLSSPRSVLASAVTASGSDVYAVGYEIEADASSTGKFWKNGVLQDFSQDVSAAQLSDVEVFDGDVYVAGVGYNCMYPIFQTAICCCISFFSSNSFHSKGVILPSPS